MKDEGILQRSNRNIYISQHNARHTFASVVWRILSISMENDGPINSHSQTALSHIFIHSQFCFEQIQQNTTQNNATTKQ